LIPCDGGFGERIKKESPAVKRGGTSRRSKINYPDFFFLISWGIGHRA